ncbi:LOW QUALITY PROTEIN: uncharacterized protein [Oscarella lobularis]|uniref:LOW QUALITY PROTEIN: uncharacterized protein n=1 Tax=Oscarella lobularis TaxID=121494 RepID=UPI003313647E
MGDIPDRTVIFIGETGAGKSSCANALAGFERFEVSASSCSVTKDVQAVTVTLPWEGKKYTVKIVDTIGIGDADFSPEEVLSRLAVACHECREGINAVFLVIGMRFTKEQAEAFDILWQVLFGPQVVELTTVVRTRFEKFNDPTAVREDKAVLQRKTGAAKRILSHIGDRLLYVDNNKDKRKALKESGSIMLKYLIGLSCKNVFRPPIMEDVRKKISEHVEEQKRLAKEKGELRKQLQQAAEAQLGCPG